MIPICLIISMILVGSLFFIKNERYFWVVMLFVMITGMMIFFGEAALDVYAAFTG
jgi:hypothetical protein